MTPQEILLAIVRLAPAEVILLDQAVHAIIAAFASGQSEAEAVASARAVMESALDAVEAAER